MSENSFMPALGISASALEAQCRRMEVIANNVANSQTMHGPDGKPYCRRDVVFAAKLDRRLRQRGSGQLGLQGVEVKEIVEDNTPFKRIHRPGHPDADAEGFVNMPNVNPMEEMVDLMTVSRAYEANIAAMKSSRTMAQKALEIGK